VANSAVRTWWIDTELRLLHIGPDCPELKYARKYGYVETKTIHNAKEAADLDREFKPCPRCKKKVDREIAAANKGNRKRGYKKKFGSVSPLDWN
jgi:hypothetical protein